jgi:DNA polymerase-3 subunit delta'
MAEPAPFPSVFGHEQARRLLGRALREGRLPGALLLTGPEGVGKRTLALEVARAALCAQEGAPGCGCTHCRRLGRSLDQLGEWREKARQATREPAGLNFRLHPDLVLAEPWPTGIKIEQVRDLVAEVMSPPFEARARAFVLDDAHRLNEQAANALLKSLEEPPATSHLLLVSAAPQQLLPTIRSRCQTLRLSALPTAALEEHLRDKAGLSPEEAHLRATLAGGSLGAALEFEADAYRGLRDELLETLEGLAGGGPISRMEAAERLSERDDLGLAFMALRTLLRDVAAARAGAPPERLLNRDVAPRLAALARGPLGANAGEQAEMAAELAQLVMKTNANKLLTMDALLEGLIAPLPLGLPVR